MKKLLPLPAVAAVAARLTGRRVMAVLALVAGLPHAAWAQGVTLADAVQSAWLRTAQSVQATGLTRKAQAERAAADALWAGSPALELGVLRNRQPAMAATRETEVGVAVPMWLPGQRAARQGQVAAGMAAAAAQEAAAKLQVAGLVREAVSDIAVQRAELAAAEAASQEMEALARDVERRVAAGDLARADALAAHAERLAATAAAAQARQALQSAQRRWQALTGLSAVPAPDAEVASAPAGEHPALQAAALDVLHARQRLDVTRASRRDAPELLVKVRQEVAAGAPTVNGVGVALRLPFGSAGRNEPLMTAALNDVDVAEAVQRELAQQLEADLATARSAQSAARQQADDQAERAALLRERAVLIEKSFKAGETPLPEMLRAVTAATQAEASVARARAALGQANARLLQAQGVMP